MASIRKPKIPMNIVGVRYLATFSHGPRLETLLESRLFAVSLSRSLAIAWPSADAEYWTNAPRMPDASKIPAVANETTNPEDRTVSISPTVVIRRKVGANWEIISWLRVLSQSSRSSLSFIKPVYDRVYRPSKPDSLSRPKSLNLDNSENFMLKRGTQ